MRCGSGLGTQAESAGTSNMRRHRRRHMRRHMRRHQQHAVPPPPPPTFARKLCLVAGALQAGGLLGSGTDARQLSPLTLCELCVRRPAVRLEHLQVRQQGRVLSEMHAGH